MYVSVCLPVCLSVSNTSVPSHLVPVLTVSQSCVLIEYPLCTCKQIFVCVYTYIHLLSSFSIKDSVLYKMFPPGLFMGWYILNFQACTQGTCFLNGCLVFLLFGFCPIGLKKQSETTTVSLLSQLCHQGLNIVLAQGTGCWPSLLGMLNNANDLHVHNVELEIRCNLRGVPPTFDALPFLVRELRQLSAHATVKLHPGRFGLSPILVKSFWILIQSPDVLSSCVYQPRIGLAHHRYPHPNFPGPECCPRWR